jgi:hypothetical protein
MGGRVVSGIAIVLSGRLATILLPLIVHNTIVFIWPFSHFLKENRHIFFKKVMFAKKVTRTVVKEVEIWWYTSLLSPIPYPLSPLPQVKE